MGDLKGKDSAAPLTCSAAASSSQALELRLPLSDKVFDRAALNKMLSSAQTREKALKVLQYLSKLYAYFLLRVAGDRASLGKHFEALAKGLSTARRCFKLFRWVKHLDDIKDAKDEKDETVRRLLLADVACNVIADVSEDITSLEKIGILRKGVLPKRTEYYANWCQLILAVVEIAVTHIKSVRSQAKVEAAGGASAPVETRRKNTMILLELSKFYADLVKAFWDCEFSFASELAFCVSGLWAALVSTHKYALRCLK